ncbi:hypothetical protein MJ561_18630 [Klebsiella pneumoniae]|nr:hypothetical protein MJ561_18630 [Klebsiella pneumoniae]
MRTLPKLPLVPAHNLQLSIDERLQTVTKDALDNAVPLEQNRVRGGGIDPK